MKKYNLFFKKKKIYLSFFCIALLFFGILFRVIILKYYNFNDVNLFADQLKYWKLSNLLLQEKFFDESFGSLRMPLYPLFLSLLRSIADNTFFVIVVQSIIGLFNLLIIYNIARALDISRSFLLVLFCFVNINFINSSMFILTEAVFLTFYLLYLYYFINFYKKDKFQIKYLIYSSIFLGLATLTRPIAAYYIYASILIILISSGNIKDKIKFLLIFYIFFSAVLLPWKSRNYVIYNNFTLSTSVADNLIGYYLPYIMSNNQNISLQDAKKKINDKKVGLFNTEQKLIFFKNELKKTSVVKIFETWTEGSIKFFFAPAISDTFYNLQIKKSSYSDLSDPEFHKKVIKYLFYNENRTLVILMIVTVVFGTVLKLLMLFYYIKNFEKHKIFNLLFLFLTLINLCLIGPLGGARYRLVLEPFFAIYIIASMNYFFNKFFKNSIV